MDVKGEVRTRVLLAQVLQIRGQSRLPDCWRGRGWGGQQGRRGFQLSRAANVAVAAISRLLCPSVSSLCFSLLFTPSLSVPLPAAPLPPPSPRPPAKPHLSTALALCLLPRSPPVFANHFFPCQQVNCFVLPFPAFITLCKLSDMSSTGARHSTHRANAKIMRFGIINEDKLAVAVLLSAPARLHYSLNLPEKMT